MSEIAELNEEDNKLPDACAHEEVATSVDVIAKQPIENSQLHGIIEAILFASDTPLSLKQLQKALKHREYMMPSTDAIKDSLAHLQACYAERGIELALLANGYRFQVKPAYGTWVGQLWDEKPPRYSRALLETLVLIAYRQPITRAEIEEVRGVAVSTHIIKTLLERGWVRVVGHKDVPGKPSLYATTKDFLAYFNLSNLDALPTLEAVRDLESIAAELGEEFEQILANARLPADADTNLASDSEPRSDSQISVSDHLDETDHDETDHDEVHHDEADQ